MKREHLKTFALLFASFVLLFASFVAMIVPTFNITSEVLFSNPIQKLTGVMAVCLLMGVIAYFTTWIKTNFWHRRTSNVTRTDVLTHFTVSFTGISAFVGIMALIAVGTMFLSGDYTGVAAIQMFLYIGYVEFIIGPVIAIASTLWIVA